MILLKYLKIYLITDYFDGPTKLFSNLYLA